MRSQDTASHLGADVLALSHDLRNPLGVITLSVDSLLRASESDELVRRLGAKPLQAIRRSAEHMERLLDELASAASKSSASGPAGEMPGLGTNPTGKSDLRAGDDTAKPSTLLTAEGLQTIGLAFVHELVRLHGGDVQIRHEPGKESQFRISIPPGAPSLRAVSSAQETELSAPMGVTAAVQKALRWLSNDELRKALQAAIPALRPDVAQLDVPDAGRALPCEGRILLAEDNAELRGYVQQILSDRWLVEAVADGSSALSAAQATLPDLILADIMMPGLDGLALVRALRADPRTKAVPILLLSAQAGQEARMEGALAGADDYMVKPFSARELIARVTLHLELGRVRVRLMGEQEQMLMRNRSDAEFLTQLGSELATPLASAREAFELIVAGARPPERDRDLATMESAIAALERVLQRVRDKSAELAARIGTD